MESVSNQPHVSVFVTNKKNQRQIGAAVYMHEPQRAVAETVADEKSLMKLTLFEFLDNEQFSNFDCFLNQIGNVVLYLSDEFNDHSKGDGRKIHNIASSKDIDIQYLKKALFLKKAETMTSVLRLLGGKTSHTSNSVETEMPVALGCAESLIHTLRLLDSDLSTTTFELSYGSLSTCMRLDSAAAEAVNLLPKADHPSQFGSLYGILNRCRTKLGSRLLDRLVIMKCVFDVVIIV